MNIQSLSSIILNKIPEHPKIGFILGSGLGGFISRIDDLISIPYSTIPNHPQTTVLGHSGEWAFGYIKNIPIIKF